MTLVYLYLIMGAGLVIVHSQDIALLRATQTEPEPVLYTAFKWALTWPWWAFKK